jgi:ribosomal 30S subunit maturation factor RimM
MQDLGRHLNLKGWMKYKTKKIKKIEKSEIWNYKKTRLKNETKKLKKKHWTLKLKNIKKRLKTESKKNWQKTKTRGKFLCQLMYAMTTFL